MTGRATVPNGKSDYAECCSISVDLFWKRSCLRNVRVLLSPRLWTLGYTSVTLLKSSHCATGRS